MTVIVFTVIVWRYERELARRNQVDIFGLILIEFFIRTIEVFVVERSNSRGAFPIGTRFDSAVLIRHPFEKVNRNPCVFSLLSIIRLQQVKDVNFRVFILSLSSSSDRYCIRTLFMQQNYFYIIFS